MRKGGCLVALFAAFARAAVACDATPELAYAEPDASAEAVDGEAVSVDGASGGDDSATVDAHIALSEGGTDAQGGGDAYDASWDARADVSSPEGTCPSIDAGVAYNCCTNVGVICVGESCNRCDDCAHAKCTPSQFCCPKFAGASNNYKGTECKSNVACQ